MPINSCSKGKRLERYIVSILNTRFADILSKNPKAGGFSRTVGSGARLSQNVILSEEAKNVYAGDIVTPSNGFNFTIECKSGYNHIDLTSAFEENKDINEFLKQASHDASRNNKKPMLIWKKDRRPELVFIKNRDIKEYIKKLSYYMKYNDWIISRFQDILQCPDHYFFREPVNIHNELNL